MGCQLFVVCENVLDHPLTVTVHRELCQKNFQWCVVHFQKQLAKVTQSSDLHIRTCPHRPNQITIFNLAGLSTATL